MKKIQDGDNTNFVYCLFNDKQAKDIKRDFYIGKTTDLISREIDHKRKKKWWDTIILFTEDKRVFEESDIGAVERILYEKYKACDLYNLKNTQHPKSDIDNYHRNEWCCYGNRYFFALCLSRSYCNSIVHIDCKVERTDFTERFIQIFSDVEHCNCFITYRDRDTIYDIRKS